MIKGTNQPSAGKPKRPLTFVLSNSKGPTRLTVEQSQVYSATGPPAIITVYQMIMQGPDGLMGVWVDQSQILELAEWIVEGPVNH
jgi:hypothetical protein